MKKPYSKRTQNTLRYAREQGAHIRDLSKAGEYFKGQKKDLEKDMMKKEGPEINGKVKLLPGYWEKQDEWNKKYERQLELEDAQEETDYPWSELVQAAVKEHGMPKGHKKRAMKNSQRLARKALAKIRSEAAKRK